MSQEYAWGPAGPCGLEQRSGAPRPMAAGGAPAELRALAAWPQVFDAAVCALAAATVFPSLFFSDLAGPAAVAVGLGIWASAYAVRPLGARAFARVADGAARPILARLLFACATTAFAFLPSAAGLAWAPALLVACRLSQGLALGGLAPGGLGGLCGRVRGLTVLAGLLAAGGLFGLFAVALRRPDFLAWGWRYPYVVALAGNMVALFADLRLRLLEVRRPGGPHPHLRLATVAGVAVEP